MPSQVSLVTSEEIPSGGDLSVLSPETARLRELFKYFLATSQAIGYVDSDIDCQSSYEPDTARLSSDPVLNSLTQLAVHRLACERAFISLIDNEHQYVIAEATREISLYDSSIHPPDQGLCIGARPLDLLSGVCAATMPAFTDPSHTGPYKSTSNVYADGSRYIINDFAIEDEYKDRPYVTGFPFMRYYAEVPLKGPSGHVIGTLAVVDNKPRVGLDERDFLAMTEISTTIMRHLGKLKVDQDHKQASRLLHGLNTFVQSGPIAYDQCRHDLSVKIDADLTPGVTTSNKHTADPTELKQLRTGIDSQIVDSDRNGHADRLSDRASKRPSQIVKTMPSPDFKHSKPLESLISAERRANSRETASGTAEVTEGDGEMKREEDSLLKNGAMSLDMRRSFSRAAYVLRQAMDLDGVVFLDTALCDSALRSDWAATNIPPGSRTHQMFPNSASDSGDDEGNGFEEFSTERAVSEALGGQASLVESCETSSIRKNMQIPVQNSARLGFSIKGSRNIMNGTSWNAHFSVSDLVHQSLLRRYPHGHIFDFNQANDPLPEEKSWHRSQKDYYNSGAGSHRKVMRRRDIDTALRLAFPNVRSLVFLPLWHPQRQSWFAGCLAWTTRQKRVLQKDDLAYVSVFGNSVIAEVTRLDLVASDRAKTDFISSISHELRSPLHGILGSAELLQEHANDSSQQQLVTMVEHCGRTMLDTVDHILDFAKISSAGSKSRNPSRKETKSIDREADVPASSSQSTFELHGIIEETINSLVAGHKYNIATTKRFPDDSHHRSYATIVRNDQDGTNNHSQEDNVTIVLNVEKKSSWNITSDMAAWRRIVLNLLGNALKYTKKGLIEVILRMNTPNSEDDLGMVKLTIRDTGCGISKEFLNTYLYTPFVQQNHLSEGTGLGLSIVQKVVHDLPGTINVQSEVGQGTQVDVLMPIPVSLSTQVTPTASTQHTGTFCLLGFDGHLGLDPMPMEALPLASRTSMAVRGALENYAEQWCGLKAVATPDISRISADIVLISEESIHLLQSNKEDQTQTIRVPLGSSVIIIAMNDAGDKWYKSHNGGRLQYVEQPIGPLKMARSINVAIQADRATAVDINEPIDIPGPAKTAPHLTLPSTGKHAAAVKAPDAHASSSIEQETKTRPNLLLVDDNKINLTMLAAHASRLKYNYATAMNGKEAVQIYCGAERPFDYVLMDVSMPVMDGFAATRAIRDFEKANSRTPTPIIALTGLGSGEAQQEAFMSGMDMFLTKPVPMRKIKILVEGGLDSLEQS